MDNMDSTIGMDGTDIRGLDELAPTIINWRVIEVDGCAEHLVGLVFDHAYLPDGTRLITPPLLWLDEAAAVARTHTQYYHLRDRAEGPLPDEWTQKLNRLLFGEAGGELSE